MALMDVSGRVGLESRGPIHCSGRHPSDTPQFGVQLATAGRGMLHVVSSMRISLTLFAIVEAARLFSKAHFHGTLQRLTLVTSRKTVGRRTAAACASGDRPC